ncbi:hypothetical protein C8R44DRAFT_876304 [Mycena epipterygia]|nr:hypothetical protein C8R44DRAFT_876304 [Mycena epipterygia]
MFLDPEHSKESLVGRDSPSGFNERGRLLLISISMISQSPSTPSPELAQSPVLDPFFQLLDRTPHWHHADLRIPFRYLIGKRAEAALHGNLHTLETLTLNFWVPGDKRYYRISETVPITTFATAPKLRAVRLTSLPLSNIILPWAQLTSFTAVAGFSMRDCVQLLQLAPYLVTCDLSYIDGELDNLTLLPVLPYLRTLALQTYRGAQILQILTLPCLTKLALPWYSPPWDDDDDNPDNKHIVPFLARSSPAGLRELSVRNSYDCFIQGLRFMPALAKLEIDDMDADEVAGVLDFLVECASSVTRLESISIRITDSLGFEWVEDMDYETVVNAIETLKDNALRSFSLTWVLREHVEKNDFEEEEIGGVRPTSDVLQQLADLRDEGLHIYLGTVMQSWI